MTVIPAVGAAASHNARNALRKADLNLAASFAVRENAGNST